MEDFFYKTSNDNDIEYRRKPSKYDFKHLIFVFSGFPGGNVQKHYDFMNGLNDCPAEVIWINDHFKGMYAYYLCVNMDFSIEDAVSEFILNKIQEGGYSLDQVTCTGFSKGGSAALYYGLKLNIKNIVVTVPQVKIGNYIVKGWPQIAEHMMGKNYSEFDIAYLNKKIVRLLKKDMNLDRNVYLLTSEADIQYETEIVPILSDLEKYSNFNLLKTDSVFVREHNQITSHHTAWLLSIYYALASETPPRFGSNIFFGSQPIKKKDSVDGEPFITLNTLKIAEDLLFIDGIGIIRGCNAIRWEDIEYELIFLSTDSEYRKKLAKDHKPYLTRHLFKTDFVIYDKGWFTTLKHAGLKCNDIPIGKYKISLSISTKNQEKEVPLTWKNKNTHVAENDFYLIEAISNEVYLTIKKTDGI